MAEAEAGRIGRRRVRLITVAWGERYIRQLCEVMMPALLAPGNIGCLCRVGACELVIVTTQDAFVPIARSPAYLALADYCPILFRSMNEFLGPPESYGMTLTWSLFSGFADLGPDMTETDLVFLNADFIVAAGSLGSVAGGILAGQRLQMAPSYCVRAEPVEAVLRARIDSDQMLALAPREMAALALRHRHNTIRGKTVNRRLFSARWIDQFYWSVDRNTLLGRQVPIAIVHMRPTRVLSEMRTFWDYGLLSEAVPGVTPRVLGDSDDFLMIELRRSDTFRGEFSRGWPSRREVARRMAHFATKDSLTCARHRLVLHSEDLPPRREAADDALDRYVASVLGHLPPVSDGFNHPGWLFHLSGFEKRRQQHLQQESQSCRKTPRRCSVRSTPAATKAR